MNDVKDYESLCDRPQGRNILAVDPMVATGGKEHFMYDAFSRIAVKANAKTACLEKADLDEIRGLIAQQNKRLDAVKILSSIASCCVSDAISGIICEDPSLVKVGGACFSNRKMAACLRDGEIILRYVTYALMAGDISTLEDRCLKGLKETYTALKVCLPSMIRAVELMKIICVAHLTKVDIDNTGRNTQPIYQTKLVAGDCSDLAAECATYFDRVIEVIR